MYETADLQEEIFRARIAVGDLTAANSVSALAKLSLGRALRTRYERFCNLPDLHEAMRLHQEALTAAQIAQLHIPLYELELSLTLRRIFDSAGDKATLETILTHQRAAFSSSKNHPELHSAAANSLATTLGIRGQLTHSTNDLNEARTLLETALSLRPPNHRDRHTTLFFLGQIAWVTKDLSNAIMLYKQALSLRPRGHPERAGALNMLGVCYHLRFEQTLDENDMKAAAKNASDALDACPPHKSILSQSEHVLNNLGTVLRQHFAAYGDVRSLDKAIAAYRQSIAWTLNSSPFRYALVINLAGALSARYIYSQVTDDITEAINLQQEELAIHSPGEIAYEGLVIGLAETFQTYREMSGETFNVRVVIDHLRTALAQAQKEAPLTMALMHQLGDTLALMYTIDGASTMLSEAIELSRSVIRAPHSGGNLQRDSMMLLAYCLRLRFLQTRDRVDAQEAIGLLQEAYEMFPADHQSRAPCAAELAHLYLYEDTTAYNVPEAIKLLGNLLRQTSRNAQRRLTDSLSVLEAIDTMLDSLPPATRDDLLEVYRVAISLLPRVAYFGLGHASQLKALKKGDSSAIMAASLALSLGKSESALELLEEGRAVFWQQYLRLRTSFEGLPTELAEELRDTCRKLEQSNEDATSKAMQDTQAASKRHLGEHLEDLLQRARCLPGLERFLLHNAYDTLRQAASKGPVIVLVPGRHNSQVIVVDNSKDAAESVLLPGVSSDVLAKMAFTLKIDNVNRQTETSSRAIRQNRGQGQHRLAEVLQDLWYKVIFPIIQHLGINVSAMNISLPVSLHAYCSPHQAVTVSAYLSALRVTSQLCLCMRRALRSGMVCTTTRFRRTHLRSGFYSRHDKSISLPCGKPPKSCWWLHHSHQNASPCTPPWRRLRFLQHPCPKVLYWATPLQR